MHINDVGQNTWEEVNEGIGGPNYGWPTYEGFDGGNAAFRDPLTVYPHSAGDPIGCAITGGAFLTASGYPGRYSNAYFYADFCSQWIYYLPAPAYNTASPFVAGLGKSSVDLQVRDGELYYLTQAAGGTVFKITYSTPRPGLRFVPVTPCRLVDTRESLGAFGKPALAGGAARDFKIQAQVACGIPPDAGAYALNVTVVPKGHLGYVTIWPAGAAQPFVSTLNSVDGRIKANAAIVSAGTNGAVSVYATDITELVVDINGYFVDPLANSQSLVFYPITPCRIADTRSGSAMLGGQTRSFAVPTSNCGVPANAQAYSLNATAVPSGPLGNLTLWPTGQAQPLVSTLNAPTGAVVANAAIVPAGSGSADPCCPRVKREATGCRLQIAVCPVRRRRSR